MVKKSFDEILGSILLEVSNSKNTYVPVEGQEILELNGIYLTFDNGWLTIENPFRVYDVDQQAAEVNTLLRKAVVEATYDDKEILISFENGFKLAVSLLSQDFKGPEAANFCPNKLGSSILVFD